MNYQELLKQLKIKDIDNLKLYQVKILSQYEIYLIVDNDKWLLKSNKQPIKLNDTIIIENDKVKYHCKDIFNHIIKINKDNTLQPIKFEIEFKDIINDYNWDGIFKGDIGYNSIMTNLGFSKSDINKDCYKLYEYKKEISIWQKQLYLVLYIKSSSSDLYLHCQNQVIYLGNITDSNSKLLDNLRLV